MLCTELAGHRAAPPRGADDHDAVAAAARGGRLRRQLRARAGRSARGHPEWPRGQLHLDRARAAVERRVGSRSRGTCRSSVVVRQHVGDERRDRPRRTRWRRGCCSSSVPDSAALRIVRDRERDLGPLAARAARTSRGRRSRGPATASTLTLRGSSNRPSTRPMSAVGREEPQTDVVALEIRRRARAAQRRRTARRDAASRPSRRAGPVRRPCRRRYELRSATAHP